MLKHVAEYNITYIQNLQPSQVLNVSSSGCTALSSIWKSNPSHTFASISGVTTSTAVNVNVIIESDDSFLMIHPVCLYLFDPDSKLCTVFAMCPDLVYVCKWQIKDVFYLIFIQFLQLLVSKCMCSLSLLSKKNTENRGVSLQQQRTC